MIGEPPRAEANFSNKKVAFYPADLKTKFVLTLLTSRTVFDTQLLLHLHLLNKWTNKWTKWNKCKCINWKFQDPLHMHLFVFSILEQNFLKEIVTSNLDYLILTWVVSQRFIKHASFPCVSMTLGMISSPWPLPLWVLKLYLLPGCHELSWVVPLSWCFCLGASRSLTKTSEIYGLK